MMVDIPTCLLQECRSIATMRKAIYESVFTTANQLGFEVPQHKLQEYEDIRKFLKDSNMEEKE